MSKTVGTFAIMIKRWNMKNIIQSYLEIELGELVLKLIIYFFSYRMETSRHKSIEESDDSDIDNIHQPAKRPRLRGKALKEKGKA